MQTQTCAVSLKFGFDDAQQVFSRVMKCRTNRKEMQIFLAHITDMTVFIMMVLSAQGLGGLKSRPGTMYNFVNFVLIINEYGIMVHKT